jgi:hypothetical protein
MRSREERVIQAGERGRERRGSSVTLQRTDTRAHTHQSSGIEMGSFSGGIEFERSSTKSPRGFVEK